MGAKLWRFGLLLILGSSFPPPVSAQVASPASPNRTEEPKTMTVYTVLSRLAPDGPSGKGVYETLEWAERVAKSLRESRGLGGGPLYSEVEVKREAMPSRRSPRTRGDQRGPVDASYRMSTAGSPGSGGDADRASTARKASESGAGGNGKILVRVYRLIGDRWVEQVDRKFETDSEPVARSYFETVRTYPGWTATRHVRGGESPRAAMPETRTAAPGASHPPGDRKAGVNPPSGGSLEGAKWRSDSDVILRLGAGGRLAIDRPVLVDGKMTRRAVDRGSWTREGEQIEVRVGAWSFKGAVAGDGIEGRGRVEGNPTSARLVFKRMTE